MRVYYFYARAYLDGVDPYDRPAVEAYGRRIGLAPFCHPTYPPPFYLALAPLCLVSPTVALALWLVAGHVALAAAFLSWRRGLGEEVRPYASLAGLLLVLLWGPLLYELKSAQANLLVVPVVAASLTLVLRGRDAAGGALLAAAVLTKVQLALLVPLLLWRRRFRAAAACILTVVSLSAVSLAALGPGPWSGYLRYVAGATSTEAPVWGVDFHDPEHLTTGALTNLSLPAMVHRLLEPTALTAPPLPASPGVVAAVVLAVSGLACLALFLATRGSADPGLLPLDLALGVIACTVAAPVAYYYSYLWLLLPLAVALPRVLERPTPSRTLALVGSCLLVLRPSFPYRLVLAEALAPSRLVAALPPTELLGALLLAGLVVSLRRDPRPR